MDTIWTRGLEKKEYPPLTSEIETEVLIIGGGLAGILCARELQNHGIECVVLEANRIGSGVTSGTTAVVSAQHSTLYQDLAAKFGVDIARGYLHANLQAVRDIASLAGAAECDFEIRPSMIYSKTDAEKMRREAQTVRELGFSAYFTDELPLGIEAAGAVVFPEMAQFHPLKFLRAAAEGLQIYELSAVKKVKDMTAYTDAGSVRAKNIIIASHFPFIDRRGLYFMKMHQARESVVVVENAPKLDVTMAEDSKRGFFLRSFDKLLIVGCGNHLPGEENEDFERISLFLNKHAPGSHEICRWVNQDCFTLDGVPYIGRYSPSVPHIFTATGFNAWGMSTSMVAAKMLTAMIMGSESPYESVFSPSRPMQVMPLLTNAARSAANLLTPTLPRCTHLGCALKHNDSAHTWDCPCHGSRFDENGAVISGPAVKKANINT